MHVQRNIQVDNCRHPKPMLSVGRNTRLRMSNQQQSANKGTSLYPYLTLVYNVTKSCRKAYHKKMGKKVNTGYRETSIFFFFENCPTEQKKKVF